MKKSGKDFVHHSYFHDSKLCFLSGRMEALGTFYRFLLLFFFFVNVFPSIHNFSKFPPFGSGLRQMGAELLILFLATSVYPVVYHIVMAFQLFPSHWLVWVVARWLPF